MPPRVDNMSIPRRKKELGLYSRNRLMDLRIIFGTNWKGEHHIMCRDLEGEFPIILGSRLLFEGRDIWAGVFVKAEADGRVCINPSPPPPPRQSPKIPL